MVKGSLRLLTYVLPLLLVLGSTANNAEPVANPFTILLEHAKNGNADAMFEVGKYYEAGDYTEQNWKEAIYWYEKAIENNHPRAMLYLGRILLGGINILKADIPRALTLIEQAANAGDAESQFQLGILFENGEAVEQDLPSAIRWYQAAAQQKYPDAKAAMKRSIEAFKNRATN